MQRRTCSETIEEKGGSKEKEETYEYIYILIPAPHSQQLSGVIGP